MERLVNDLWYCMFYFVPMCHWKTIPLFTRALMVRYTVAKQSFHAQSASGYSIHIQCQVISGTTPAFT